MKRHSLIAALMLTLAATPVRADIIDRVLAVVGSQVVTLSDVRAAETFGLLPPATAAAGTEDVLARLVNRHLMLGEVERYSAPDPEPSLVDRRMAQVRSAFAGDPDYAQALARTAMTEGRLRSIVVDNLRIEAYIDQRFGPAAQPTLDEIQRYYRQHPDEFTQSGRLAAFEEVQQSVQQKVSTERKRALIADWLDRLRRRGFVTTLSPTGR